MAENAVGTHYWYDLTGLALETGAERATYLRDPSGMLLSAVTSTGFHNYATDRLGSVTATTGPTGDLSATYRYHPYGALLSSTGTGRNPYRYTGTYLDGSTGLYQMGARYYQPGTGRFTQRDPVDGWSYHYANSNPVNYTDPAGLNPLDCGWSGFWDCASNDLADLFDSASASLSGNGGSFGSGSGGGGADMGGGGSYLDYWYNANFDSVWEAFDYHYNTHVIQAGYTQTPEEYTAAALSFQRSYTGRWRPRTLEDGTQGWIGVTSSGGGGIYSADWSIVSYWYD